MTEYFRTRVQRGTQCDANMDMGWDCRSTSGMHTYLICTVPGSAAAVASQESAIRQEIPGTRYAFLSQRKEPGISGI